MKKSIVAAIVALMFLIPAITLAGSCWEYNPNTGQYDLTLGPPGQSMNNFHHRGPSSADEWQMLNQGLKSFGDSIHKIKRNNIRKKERAAEAQEIIEFARENDLTIEEAAIVFRTINEYIGQ